MSKKPLKTAPTKSAASKAGRIIVLFGLDDKAQPRAASFTNDDETLLTRLAQALGLRVGITTGTKHAAILSKLPQGDVHATGKTAVPNIPPDLYEKLNALVGGETGA